MEPAKMSEKIIEKSANLYEVARRNGHKSWTDIFVAKNKGELKEQLKHPHIHSGVPKRIASGKFRIQFDNEAERPEYVAQLNGEDFYVRDGDLGYHHLTAMFSEQFSNMTRDEN